MIAPLSSKNGYTFGFRWSLLGCALALVYITSCELLIPPDRSVPRYNTVNGERRRPELNPGGANFNGQTSMTTRIAAIDYAYGGPVAPETSAVASAPLPPSPKQAAPTQDVAAAKEDTRFPPAPKMSAAPQAEEKGFWSSLAFWREDEKIPEAPLSERRRPVENANASTTVAAATASPVASNELAPLPGSYPSLNATPDKPSVASIDNSKQKAMATRSELETDRTAAMAAREQVLKDAASEPSLLANPPATAAASATTPAIANLPPPPSRMTPEQSAQVSQAMATPPAAVSTAPSSGSAFERLTQKPLTTSSVAPARVTAAPITPPAASAARPVLRPALPSAAPSSSAMEPIRLTPPAATAPEPVQAASSLAVTPDASIPLSSPFATTPSVNVGAAPAVVGIPSANPQASASLEPIRLVPPGAAMSAPQSSAVAGTGTATASVQPVTGQRYIHNQAYLPQSRYAQRRR